MNSQIDGKSMIDFRNKTILITGGTGSFGGHVMNRLLKEDVKEIRIFSRDELKQEELRIKYSDSRLNFVIGDVRDHSSILSAMRGIDYLFHAAALKQVPSCEFFPMQAIQTNILGTENVLEAAAINGVKKAVVLSTDKAVYPINTMGMSKALMEKIAISKSRDPRLSQNNRVISVTRYGNVMCSRGSIIPLFVKQIKSGSPLTITDPNMTRFMMSLEESVDLVLYAFSNGKPGDTFVQKAPSATIETLANALMRIFDISLPVNIIGPRHGEKLYESLCGSEEMQKAVDLGEYFRIPADLRDLNYGKYIQESKNLFQSEEYNSHNTKRLNCDEMVEVLMELDFIKAELATR